MPAEMGKMSGGNVSRGNVWLPLWSACVVRGW